MKRSPEEAIQPTAGEGGSSGRLATPQDTAEAALDVATLLAASSDCVKLIALDGTLEFMSSTGEALLEFGSGGAPLGALWADLWPQESRPLVEDALQQAREGHSARFAGYCPTAAGNARWWDVAVSPVRDAGGVTRRFLSISRDITQQRLAEKALAESEQRFRALADNMLQLAWMADAEGRVFWLNARWCEFTGRTVGDLAGEGWRSVHHPDHVDRVAERIAAAVSTGEMWQEVLPLRAADGAYHWFLARAVPVRDASGAVRLWCATHTDISEQRAMSQRLRELARLIELSHEAILAWDFENGIILWNKGCEELYGYRRSETLGKRSHLLLRARHPDGLESFTRNILRDGEWAGEVLHHAADGTEIWVESRQELIRAGGRNIVLETNRDITERRRADAVREMLVAELDHRVKNTLAIVQSLANQTARTQSSLDAFFASFAGRLQALATAQTILSDAHWAGAGLRGLVTSQLAVTLGTVGSAATAQRILIEGEDVFVAPQAAVHLALIVHELASNARRHGALREPGGMVRICWHLAGPEDGASRRVVLEWQESGGGAVDRTSRRGFGRELIARAGSLPFLSTELDFDNGGLHCRISADLSTDTEYRRYFQPGAKDAVHAPEPTPARRRRLAGRRVLLIEDDPVEAFRIEEALADAGYLVVGPARSAEAARRYLEDPAFDLAVVDLHSPALEGEQLLSDIGRLGRPRIAVVDPSYGGPRADGTPVVPAPVSPVTLLAAMTALSTTE